MHTISKFASVSCLLLVGFSTLVFTGCTVPRPEVTTFWQKLGFPQARASFRDNLINRRGNRPDLEAKPRLLKIADPANLESPSDLLKGAAEIKAEEDMAPQKIKALKYLAGVACGCNEEVVEKAIVKGLNDCTAEVRREALNVVLASTKPENKCDNKRKRKIFKNVKCKLCKGGGCQGCRFQGCQQECCEVAVACQSCGACCGKEVQKRLKQMAYETKKNGCWFEPLADLRAAAANALAQCPALPEEPKVPTKADPDLKGEPGEDGDVPTPEPGSDDDEDDEEKKKKAKADGQTTQRGVSNQSDHQRRVAAQNVSYSPNRVARLRPQMGIAPNPNMVLGEIIQVDAAVGEVRIQLEQAYEFPEGYQFILSRPNGLQMDFKIVKTTKGGIVAVPVTPVDLQNQLLSGDGVWIGILGY